MYCNVVAEKKKLTKIKCRYSWEFLKIFTFTKLAKYFNHCQGVNFFIRLHADGLQHFVNMNLLSHCFSYENRNFLTGVFFFSSPQQLLLRSLLIKGKNSLSSKIKFRKSYWASNKNNNVICVVGWSFIILLSFSLSFIYTSFAFVVESWNFDAPENLTCVKQQELIDIKHHKFLNLFIIPKEILYSTKTYLAHVTSTF